LFTLTNIAIFVSSTTDQVTKEEKDKAGYAYSLYCQEESEKKKYQVCSIANKIIIISTKA